MTILHSYAIDTIDDINDIERSTYNNTTRILLIEDSKSDVFLVKRMLRNVSKDDELEITDVPRMVDALELLDDAEFDVVLLDLSLLDIDGVAAVTALHAVTPNTPIIVYSGTQDPKLREGAMMCGAKHFLMKGKESAFSLKFMIQQACVCEAI